MCQLLLLQQASVTGTTATSTSSHSGRIDILNIFKRWNDSLAGLELSPTKQPWLSGRRANHCLTEAPYSNKYTYICICMMDLCTNAYIDDFNMKYYVDIEYVQIDVS